MVDDDRLDELLGGGGDDDDEEEFESASEIDPPTLSGSANKEKKDTKKNKISQFKGNTSSDDGGTGDIKTLLFTLANMDAYTRVVVDYEFSGFNNAQEKVKNDFAKDVSGEITNFLGVFNIRDITNKYGYEWKNILSIAINNQDMGGETLKTNSGNQTSSDIRDLLDCIANVILFVEGNVRSKEEKDNTAMKDKVQLRIAKGMYEQYNEIISRNEVQKIAEKHGYDWKDDILKGVLTEQDFEKRIR